jgi:beta-lactamase class A
MRLSVVLVAVLLAGACSEAPVLPPPASPPPVSKQAHADPAALTELERQHGARLGMFSVNVTTGEELSNRANERFAMASTFKTYAAAALLKAHPLATGYFNQTIRFTQADIVANSPVTSGRVATGMTVAELCEAAITKSDNAAGNVLLKLLGGPQAITQFARTIGDNESRLDRWETELNTAIPGDERDTTTPKGIAAGYRALVLGDALPAPERDQLKAWLLANTTGGERIRAGVPKSWATADKTGTGSYASANDVAITWTENQTPIVIAILTTKPAQDAKTDNALLADAAKIAARELAS